MGVEHRQRPGYNLGDSYNDIERGGPSKSFGGYIGFMFIAKRYFQPA